MGLLAPKMKTQPRKGLWVHPSCVEEAGRAQDTQKERGICWTWTRMMTRELGLGMAASDVFRGSQEGYRGDTTGLAKCLLSEPVFLGSPRGDPETVFSVAVPNAAEKMRLRCGGGVSFDRRDLENVELFTESLVWRATHAKVLRPEPLRRCIGVLCKSLFSG